MLPDTVSRTAIGTTVGRAIESRGPKSTRLFEDPFAMRFLPPVYRALVRLLLVPLLGPGLLAMRERRVPGIAGNLLCRTRFIDDAFRKALANGHRQAVILGAGFDSRAYRISGADRVRVFELDHPATQAWKRESLEREGELAPHVTFVSIDFERQELEDVLAPAGFRRGVKTFVLWEGVTQYLGEDAVDSTFRSLSRVAGSGSSIVFTYVLRGIIDGTERGQAPEKLLAELSRQGEPWVFGIVPEELARYLTARGLELVEDVGAEDYRTLYLDPMGRRVALFNGERVAVARVP